VKKVEINLFFSVQMMNFFRPDFKTKTRIFSAKKLQNPDLSKKSMDSLEKVSFEFDDSL
jgi:hypothetical protein